MAAVLSLAADAGGQLCAGHCAERATGAGDAAGGANSHGDALDNGTALISIDNDISFISSINNSNAYLVYYSKDGYKGDILLVN